MRKYIKEIYVRHTATGDGTGTSWANAIGGAGTDAQAAAALKAAVEAALPGECVYVGPGTFAMTTNNVTVPTCATVDNIGMVASIYTSTRPLAGAGNGPIILMSSGSHWIGGAIQTILEPFAMQAPFGIVANASGWLIEDAIMPEASDGFYLDNVGGTQADGVIRRCNIFSKWDCCVVDGPVRLLVEDCIWSTVLNQIPAATTATALRVLNTGLDAGGTRVFIRRSALEVGTGEAVSVLGGQTWLDDCRIECGSGEEAFSISVGVGGICYETNCHYNRDKAYANTEDSGLLYSVAASQSVEAAIDAVGADLPAASQVSMP